MDEDQQPKAHLRPENLAHSKLITFTKADIARWISIHDTWDLFTPSDRIPTKDAFIAWVKTLPNWHERIHNFQTTRTFEVADETTFNGIKYGKGKKKKTSTKTSSSPKKSPQKIASPDTSISQNSPSTKSPMSKSSMSSSSTKSPKSASKKNGPPHDPRFVLELLIPLGLPKATVDRFDRNKQLLSGYGITMEMSTGFQIRRIIKIPKKIADDFYIASFPATFKKFRSMTAQCSSFGIKFSLIPENFAMRMVQWIILEAMLRMDFNNRCLLQFWYESFPRSTKLARYEEFADLFPDMVSYTGDLKVRLDNIFIHSAAKLPNVKTLQLLRCQFESDLPYFPDRVSTVIVSASSSILSRNLQRLDSQMKNEQRILKLKVCNVDQIDLSDWKAKICELAPVLPNLRLSIIVTASIVYELGQDGKYAEKDLSGEIKE
eukprot:TRINITY_DN22708_c0_g1_i1.p1 TRINITY_DN22708_c0_g1~~TRINITY_DN22708_c0_g1_i1.p1  ORF type:complete len:433 (+),score=73.37 TRINITY_DN22708_c0_g1_i1:2-1300(+)